MTTVSARLCTLFVGEHASLLVANPCYLGFG